MLKTGARLRSQVCGTEVVVVRPGGPDTGNAADAVVECGGHPMIDLTGTPSEGLALVPEFATGTLLGKRYTDESGALELLVTHAGEGALALGGRMLAVKSAKPLPSSD
jgi:hypothetical protein